MSDFIKVKEGVTHSVAHEINSHPSIDDYIADQIIRIDHDNPSLMEEICCFAMETAMKVSPADRDMVRVRMVSAGILVYRMLESQHEASELEKLLGD